MPRTSSLFGLHVKTATAVWQPNFPSRLHLSSAWHLTSAALRCHLVYTQLKHYHQMSRWGGRAWHGLKSTSYLFYVAAVIG